MKKRRNAGASLKEEALFGVFECTPTGFGFVRPEGFDEDVFIPKRAKLDAMHGDLVSFVITKRPEGTQKAEGEVIRILERRTSQVVGTFFVKKAKGKRPPAYYGFVLPDNSRLCCKFRVSKERSKGAKDGQKVVLRITAYRDRKNHKKGEGIINEILGYPTDPGVDIAGLVRSYGLSEVFPPEVRKEAKMKDRPVTQDMTAGRSDLRDQTVFTIDGDDSKDFDDAVSLEVKDGRFHLGVHIADVTAYVKEDSALDRQALLRGTSVYLPGLVIPMLPETLSNGICSLNPDEDRLTLSCLMIIDSEGTVVDHRIEESVIRSCHRMTYSDVNRIIEEKEPVLCEKYADIVPVLLQMNDLAGILWEKRRRRGSLDFDFPETRIDLDENGRVADVRPYDRNSATGLIEEFMIAANETVAQMFCHLELPFIYRSHEDPDREKLENLNAFINGLGYHLNIPRGDIRPSLIRGLLDEISGRPEQPLIERLTLRSLKQARYTVEPLGHFGLASTYYCHFTSPIRRYPDLQIHRIIKEFLAGKLDEKRIAHYEAILPDVALQSSRLERNSVDAERECEDMKKAEYMQSHIGEVFDGVISSVTDWGIYVELDNTVEGMIPLRSLTDDYYICDEEEYRVYGRFGKKEFRLGQRIKITVERADVQSREIDFLPADF
ncbi:MAG: ribonuclease R [Lachnospiraceae bacterium]|nr:ribonuclease R [Lachnospiraceae bacterium]